MTHPFLVHHLAEPCNSRRGDRVALSHDGLQLSYADFHDAVCSFRSGLLRCRFAAGERVGVYLGKRLESVIAKFGTMAAGGVMVPINPVLKAHQVDHILRDCRVSVIVTSRSRLDALKEVLTPESGLRYVVLTDGTDDESGTKGFPVHSWADFVSGPTLEGHSRVDTDVAAILYTSGSTGRPKGVVLSHRNLVAGAASVSAYLANEADDVLLAVLPLSFDAGFSQLTTAFLVGARVALLNHLVARDVVNAMASEGVTGLTAVPPLYVQLTAIEWPAEATKRLRYFATTGGRMPMETLRQIRSRAPRARPFLMYGLTEAFRATYLPPDQVDHRPDSIGRAIPNAEVLVLRSDGTPCDADEPGELVQRGPLVALGYWNDPERSAERFRPLPPEAQARQSEVVPAELAVFSGDIVRRDVEGYLYFVGRRGEMIKTSGYRVSPTEVEEALYSIGTVAECAVFGVPDDGLGERIVAAVLLDGIGADQVHDLARELSKVLPRFMVPAEYWQHFDPLPRGPNGKLDRRLLADQWIESNRLGDPAHE